MLCFCAGVNGGAVVVGVLIEVSCGGGGGVGQCWSAFLLAAR